MSRERPNRSDVHLTLEEEAKIEDETRKHFDSLAPKRHSKPQRSDYSSHYHDDPTTTTTTNTNDDDITPELTKFQHLQNHPPPLELVSDGTQEQVTEEYIETEYYKDLNCIDKQHHTTGTGFIKVSENNSNGFKISSDPSTTEHHSSCKGNPATNDWIPVDSVSTATLASSHKPNRSDI